MPFKRFQRRHVDSLWQADVYKFRIAGVRGHVYVHTILDDRSRFLVMARAYRRERAREATQQPLVGDSRAVASPRRSTSTTGAASSRRSSGATASARASRVIYGRPYHPRGPREARAVPRHPDPGAGRDGCASVRSATSAERFTPGERSTTERASTGGSAGRPRPRSYNDPKLMSRKRVRSR